MTSGSCLTQQQVSSSAARDKNSSNFGGYCEDKQNNVLMYLQHKITDQLIMAIIITKINRLKVALYQSYLVPNSELEFRVAVKIMQFVILLSSVV